MIASTANCLTTAMCTITNYYIGSMHAEQPSQPSYIRMYSVWSAYDCISVYGYVFFRLSAATFSA